MRKAYQSRPKWKVMCPPQRTCSQERGKRKINLWMLKIWKTSKHSSRSQEEKSRTALIDSARGMYKLKVIENVFWNICYLMQTWIIFSCWRVGFAASFQLWQLKHSRAIFTLTGKQLFQLHGWSFCLTSFLGKQCRSKWSWRGYWGIWISSLIHAQFTAF